MKQTPNVLKRFLIVSTIVGMLAVGGLSYSTDLGPVAVETVVFSVEEADSLLDLIDDQALEIRLLRIDLTEAQKLAVVDSTLSDHMLTMQKQSYEDIIDLYKSDREHWLVKSLKHPAIWFMVGAYAGLQVAK